MNYVDVFSADDGMFLYEPSLLSLSLLHLTVARLGSGRQQWTALPVPNTTNQFNLLIKNGRNGCNDYLSTADCTNSSNLVDMFGNDDGSGRQRWVLTPITQ